MFYSISQTLKTKRLTVVSVLFALVAVGLPAQPSIAADGVLEINSVCAVNTGCFAGDSPGFPVEITGAAPSKSFRLTGDLIIPSVNDDGILVSANDVTIDLGGFAIMGVACVGTELDCTPGASGSGDGIDSVSPAGVNFGLTVKNGVIVGMGRRGLDIGNQSNVQGVHTRWNGTLGMFVGSNSTIADSSAIENAGTGMIIGKATATRLVALRNGATGISASSGATLDQVTAGENNGSGINVSSHGVIRNSTASLNGDGGTSDDGISCGAGSIVVNSIAENNDGDGIDCAGDSSLIGNVSRSNEGDGIECDNSCTISDSSVVGNGDQAGDDGISCGQGCNVRGNTVRANFENGIQLGAESGYSHNILSNNSASAVSGGVNLIGNLCDGTSCP